mgnify:CR=1 FL=1
MLFFGGARLWPNKRQRMLTGYGMFVFAIAAPPLVSAGVVWGGGVPGEGGAGGGRNNSVLWRATAMAQQASADADWVWHVCLCYCSTTIGKYRGGGVWRRVVVWVWVWWWWWCVCEGGG